MRWLDGITNATNMNLGRLQEMARGREAWHAAIHGVTNWTTTHKYKSQGTFKAPSLWEEILPFLGSSPPPCSLTDPLCPRAPFQHNAPHFSGKWLFSQPKQPVEKGENSSCVWLHSSLIRRRKLCHPEFTCFHQQCSRGLRRKHPDESLKTK